MAGIYFPDQAKKTSESSSAIASFPEVDKDQEFAQKKQGKKKAKPSGVLQQESSNDSPMLASEISVFSGSIHTIGKAGFLEDFESSVHDEVEEFASREVTIDKQKVDKLKKLSCSLRELQKIYKEDKIQNNVEFSMLVYSELYKLHNMNMDFINDHNDVEEKIKSLKKKIFINNNKMKSTTSKGFEPLRGKVIKDSQRYEFSKLEEDEKSCLKASELAGRMTSECALLYGEYLLQFDVFLSKQLAISDKDSTDKSDPIIKQKEIFDNFSSFTQHPSKDSYKKLQENLLNAQKDLIHNRGIVGYAEFFKKKSLVQMSFITRQQKFIDEEFGCIDIEISDIKKKKKLTPIQAQEKSADYTVTSKVEKFEKEDSEASSSSILDFNNQEDNLIDLSGFVHVPYGQFRSKGIKNQVEKVKSSGESGKSEAKAAEMAGRMIIASQFPIYKDGTRVKRRSDGSFGPADGKHHDRLTEIDNVLWASIDGKEGFFFLEGTNSLGTKNKGANRSKASQMQIHMFDERLSSIDMPMEDGTYVRARIIGVGINAPHYENKKDLKKFQDWHDQKGSDKRFFLSTGEFGLSDLLHKIKTTSYIPII